MIGSNLVKKLVDDGHNVFVADNLWRGKREYLFSDKNKMVIPENNFYQIDLRNYENCLKVTKNIDIVIHLADIVAGINYVFANESSVYRSNILINTNTLQAVYLIKLKIYLCWYSLFIPKIKTIKFKSFPFKEDDVYPAEPESAYG